MIRPVTSASNVHRRALCPGSENLERGVADEDSEDAKVGTLLHAYDSNPKLDRAVLTSYQRDLLRISAECDDFVFARVAEQFELSKDDAFTEGREEPLFALRGTEFETPGHCDRWRIYRSKNLVVIIDKKTGFREVTTAAANFQLRCYAIAAAEEWNADNIVVAITQPRLSYERRVTMAAYTREDIASASVELGSIREASRDPKAPLHAGDEQCRYCRAKTICAEYKLVIESGLALIPLNGEMTVAAREAQIEAAVRKLSDTQLDKALLGVQFASWIADPARDEARRRKAENPDCLAEWTVGKPSEIRKITDPKRAIQLLSLRADLSKDEILSCCAPKIGELETKVREKKHLAWKDAKQIVEDTLAPVIVREEKRPTLTRASK